MRYEIVIEKSGGFGACVPELPGVEAIGPTRAHAMKMIREAIRIYDKERKTTSKTTTVKPNRRGRR